MGFLPSFSSLKTWLIAGGAVAIAAGGIIAWYQFVTLPAKNAEIAKQEAAITQLTKDNANLETANKTLQTTMATLGAQLQDALEYARVNAETLNAFSQAIANAENEIRDEADQQRRRMREANGDAKGVLYDDQSQWNCLWSHLGDRSGSCKNGVWVTQ